MIKPYMVDLGYSVKEIGVYSGIIGTSVAVLVSIAAGLMIKKTGRNRSALYFALMGFTATFYFFVVSFFHPALGALLVGICLLWGAYGASSVLIYTISMDMVRPGREGTDFTLQIVITHLSSLIIVVASGKIGDLFGYSGLFGMELVLCTVAISIVYFTFSKKIVYEHTS
jgi:MFS family permease